MIHPTTDYRLELLITRDGQERKLEYFAFACKNKDEAIKRAKENKKGARILSVTEE